MGGDSSKMGGSLPRFFEIEKVKVEYLSFRAVIIKMELELSLRCCLIQRSKLLGAPKITFVAENQNGFATRGREYALSGTSMRINRGISSRFGGAPTMLKRKGIPCRLVQYECAREANLRAD